jgi:hypothetical protein
VAKIRTELALDHAYLKERLHYDPSTGVFTWLAHKELPKTWNIRYAGTPAGSVNANLSGYRKITISIRKTNYLASRLAWFYVTGSWPSAQLDHINHDSLDNRFANLREVSNTENSKNRSLEARNKSGATGVRYRKNVDRWDCHIGVAGRHVHGGRFKTFEEAVAKRKELEKTYGFHPNHGVA